MVTINGGCSPAAAQARDRLEGDRELQKLRRLQVQVASKEHRTAESDLENVLNLIKLEAPAAHQRLNSSKRKCTTEGYFGKAKVSQQAVDICNAALTANYSKTRTNLIASECNLSLMKHYSEIFLFTGFTFLYTCSHCF